MLDEAVVESNELAVDQTVAVSGQSPSVVPRPPRCRHLSAHGRQCRLSQISNLGFCSKHLDEALTAETKRGEALATELIGDRENFKTAVAVNDFVGKAIRLFIQKRLSRGDANTLIRFAQLLVCTFRPMENEYRAIGGSETWEEMIADNLPANAFGEPAESEERGARGAESGENANGEIGGHSDETELTASDSDEVDQDERTASFEDDDSGAYADEALLDSAAEE